MTKSNFLAQIQKIIFAESAKNSHQCTADHLAKLFDIGKKDLSHAKICEAHFDALSILAEADRKHHSNNLYGVWASEIPGKHLKLVKIKNKFYLSGEKMFCSGAGLLDRALVTAVSNHPILVDVDLKQNADKIKITKSLWYTHAFQETNTANVIFDNVPVEPKDIIGDANWYTTRRGFWAGAVGPAACWAGGAAGIVEYAQHNKRHDPHTIAHLGAMYANIWAMKSLLIHAGNAIETQQLDIISLHELALMVRHQIEQLSTDILRRFARAYGPFPLACVESISRRYQELDLYLRQNHAERDLETLGMLNIQKIFNEKEFS